MLALEQPPLKVKENHKFGDSGGQRVYITPYKAGYRRSVTHLENELRPFTLAPGLARNGYSNF